MELKPEIRTEDGKEYYYFRFRSSGVAKSVTVYEVITGVIENRKVCYFELRVLPAELKEPLAKLATEYSNVLPTGAGYRFTLREDDADRIFEDGITVFDFAADGSLVGIEIV